MKKNTLEVPFALFLVVVCNSGISRRSKERKHSPLSILIINVKSWDFYLHFFSLCLVAEGKVPSLLLCVFRVRLERDVSPL